MKRKIVIMLGSVPMSLEELAMAPALLAANVRSRGHHFRYIDINLDLYDLCDRDLADYEQKKEILQSIECDYDNDRVIKVWYQQILQEIKSADVVLINVFSIFSHAVSINLCGMIRQQYPDKIIAVGGIGSQKKIFAGITDYNRHWVQTHFPDTVSDVLGQMLLDQQLADHWQAHVGMEVLDQCLPVLPSTWQGTLDFSCYDLDRYIWKHRKLPLLGSHGCVRQCSFCDVIVHFPKYHFVEADQLTKDIVEAYQQTGIHRVQFMDSLVNGSMSNFLKLLRNLAHAKKQGWLPSAFAWSGTYIARAPSSLLDQIHENLESSGAETLVIGVESGSDRVRWEMDKKFSNQDLLHELLALSRGSVCANLLFFASWPTETLEDFEQTQQLFTELSPLAQTGTVHQISLGHTGFSLLDGTPIDDRRQEIGLRPGPRPWLWSCDSNPGLDFWESVRRRLSMADHCENLGLRLDSENAARRLILFRLKEHRDAIRHWAGRQSLGIQARQRLQDATPCALSMQVVNAGQYPVLLQFTVASDSWHIRCDPGTTPVAVTFDRSVLLHRTFCMTWKFDNRHVQQYAAFDNGEIYDVNGVFLNLVKVDQRDITISAWDALVTRQSHTVDLVAQQSAVCMNKRCISGNQTLSWELDAGESLHRRVLDVMWPNLAQERSIIDREIQHLLDLAAS